MTMPVSNRSALIPRKPQRFEANNRPEDDDEIKGLPSYAPPGASFRAKVRRLGEDAGILEIEPVTEKLGGTINSVTGASGGKQNNLQETSIRIQAEVNLSGVLPPEGLVIETATHVRPRENKKGSEK